MSFSVCRGPGGYPGQYPGGQVSRGEEDLCHVGGEADYRFLQTSGSYKCSFSRSYSLCYLISTEILKRSHRFTSKGVIK